MGLTDLQASQQTLQGLFEAVCVVPGDTANAFLETEVNFSKADDANATATLAETVLQTCPRRATLKSAAYVSNTATGLTAVAANYTQLVFNARNGVGGSSLALGTTNSQPTANGGTGNWSQWNTVALTVAAFDPNNAVIPAGGMLNFSIAKQGAGVITPGGTLTARIFYM